MYNSSVEVENLNEQFKIQTMNFGGDRTPYISPVDASKLNSWFSHDVTKIQTKKLSILPISYFHDVLEQLKTNFHTNLRFKRVVGFVLEYA